METQLGSLDIVDKREELRAMTRRSINGESFAHKVAAFLNRFEGRKQTLALAIGISPSTLSHLAAGTAEPGIEVCLKLAAVSGQSASELLRSAKKGHVAKLIEQCYGPATTCVATKGEITIDEKLLILRMRRLSKRAHRAIQVLVDDVAQEDVSHEDAFTHNIQLRKVRRHP